MAGLAVADDQGVDPGRGRRSRPDLRRRLDAGLVRAGRSLQEDPALQAKVDGWVERVVTYLAEEYGHEIADLIATTVARWDGAEASRRIELQVGRDLQFIRINGTVVGGLAGLIIYSVGQFLRAAPARIAAASPAASAGPWRGPLVGTWRSRPRPRSSPRPATGP